MWTTLEGRQVKDGVLKAKLPARVYGLKLIPLEGNKGGFPVRVYWGADVNAKPTEIIGGPGGTYRPNGPVTELYIDVTPGGGVDDDRWDLHVATDPADIQGGATGFRCGKSGALSTQAPSDLLFEITGTQIKTAFGAGDGAELYISADGNLIRGTSEGVHAFDLRDASGLLWTYSGGPLTGGDSVFFWAISVDRAGPAWKTITVPGGGIATQWKMGTGDFGVAGGNFSSGFLKLGDVVDADGSSASQVQRMWPFLLFQFWCDTENPNWGAPGDIRLAAHLLRA